MTNQNRILVTTTADPTDPFVATVRDRDHQAVTVGREIDLCGIAAEGSPDVVLQIGDPATRGSESYLTPGQARDVALALTHAATTPADEPPPALHCVDCGHPTEDVGTAPDRCTSCS